MSSTFGPLVDRGPRAHSPGWPLRTGIRGLVRTLGTGTGAWVDGLLAGWAAAFVIGVGLTGMAQHYGLGVLDCLVPAVLSATAMVAVGATVVLAAAILRRASAAARTRLTARGRRPSGAVMAGTDRAVGRLPARSLGLAAAVAVLGLLVPPEGPLAILRPNGVLVVPMLVAAVTVGLVNVARVAARTCVRQAGHSGRVARASAAGALAFAVVVGTGGAAWAAWPGDTAALVPWSAAVEGVPEASALDDPSAPGPYPVITTSYGSGTDRHRPAFGPDVAIRTQAVSAPSSLAFYDGLAGDAYRMFWGFDFDALPLNALVWYPVGAGPFPLVLIVHGNHAMGEFSEGGYGYLAERLASHGMIAASIDQNFLNGGFTGELGGKEMAVRAWMLLLHLDQWRAWNENPASRFEGMVDLSRVALVGHSRGGEAASVAASFATNAIAPVTGMEPWPVGLTVRSVVSIAPSDGFYGHGTLELSGVDFLTIAGGQDTDAAGWSGIRQYGRATPAPGGFKAAAWIQRANHGQFNSVWGATDQGPLTGWLVNRAALLTPAEQETVARVLVGGFLMASLQDRAGYRALFRTPGIGGAWLPDTPVVTRSWEAAPRVLLDPESASVVTPEIVTVEHEGFTSKPAVMDMPLRAIQGGQQNFAVVLRWNAGDGDATYRLNLPVDRASTLRFALADGRPTGQSPVNVHVTVTTGARAVSLPLSTWGDLPLPMPGAPFKSAALAAAFGIGAPLRTPVERVLRTYAVPLADFQAVDPAFDPTAIDSVAFSFGREEGGSVWLDEVAISE